MKHSAARLNENRGAHRVKRKIRQRFCGRRNRDEVVERARPQVQPAAHGHSSRDRTRQWPRHSSGDGTWSAGTLRETKTKLRRTREDRWKSIEPRSRTKNRNRSKSNRWHGSPGEPEFRATQRRRAVRDKQGFERRACDRRREDPWAKTIGWRKISTQKQTIRAAARFGRSTKSWRAG
jgi:hypothetical protein